MSRLLKKSKKKKIIIMISTKTEQFFIGIVVNPTIIPEYPFLAQT